VPINWNDRHLPEFAVSLKRLSSQSAIETDDQILGQQH